MLTAGSAVAYSMPTVAPALDPHFIPMLENVLGIQPMTGDAGLLFHMRQRIFTYKETGRDNPFLAYELDPPEQPGISIDMVSAHVGTAPVLDLRVREDRHRLMNMMVDYIATSTTAMPYYVGNVEHPSVFKRAMNHIAKMNRRGMGNVLIANQEGFRRLNGSWKHWKSVRTIRLPLDDREPFALLGYDGKNQYDTGILLGLRIDDNEFAKVKSLWGRYGTKDQWREFMNTKMNMVRPVFTENPNSRFAGSRYWRRLV